MNITITITAQASDVDTVDDVANTIRTICSYALDNVAVTVTDHLDEV